MQIRTIPKSYFNSTEVQGMGDAIVKVIDSEKAFNQSIVQNLLSNLKASLSALDQSRANTNLNTQTAMLEEADLARDYAFRAFWNMIEAGTMRRQESYREAALTIQNYFKPFDRNLHTFGYGKETIALKDFMAAMEKEDAQQALTTMRMQDWLSELKEAQEQFLAIYEHKIKEETQKNALTPTREARRQVLDLLNALTQTLNALQIGGDKNIATLNAHIDSIIEAYETKARSRKTRKKNEGKQTQEESIDGEY